MPVPCARVCVRVPVGACTCARVRVRVPVGACACARVRVCACACLWATEVCHAPAGVGKISSRSHRKPLPPTQPSFPVAKCGNCFLPQNLKVGLGTWATASRGVRRSPCESTWASAQPHRAAQRPAPPPSPHGKQCGTPTPDPETDDPSSARSPQLAFGRKSSKPPEPRMLATLRVLSEHHSTPARVHRVFSEASLRTTFPPERHTATRDNCRRPPFYRLCVC
ncbi:uncharacterized protein LOC126934423 [Macaca thibetana thibetana]|uniref:uncharacterized protein LOC126934423 n=1 Tax=Macaca thibetana thibetana TaxID=257877 RepID=UPI0021BC6DF3|nr:uncharacterized protein LOC126934423 [Macaca thibetana thibetana]